MCPACMTTLATVALGTASGTAAGGVSILAVRRWLVRRTSRPQPQDPFESKSKEDVK